MLQQGRVLAPLQLGMLYTTVLRMVDTRFFADAAIMDHMVQPQRKKGKRKKKVTPRTGHVDGRGGKKEAQEAQGSWGMLYADDLGVVARSPGGLERMMAVIVTACSAFGLTVTEANTEVICLQTKHEENESFTINTASDTNKQKSELVCTWAGLSAQMELSVEKTRRLQRA